MTLSATPGNLATLSALTVSVDWTYREGNCLMGVVLFHVTPSEESEIAAAGKDPQFLISGSTRRKTVELVCDYAEHAFASNRVALSQALSESAHWLGMGDRPLLVQESHEWRSV